MSADPDHQALLARLRQQQPQLDALHTAIGSGSVVSDDLMYRFWHQSLKVYGLQQATLDIRRQLEQAADPDRGLDPWYETIVTAGTGHRFTLDDNSRWLDATGPIVTAYLHSAHLLRLARDAAERYETAPEGWYEPGWATLLHLYRMR